MSSASNIDGLLRRAVEMGASDLHLRSDLPPILRIHGEMERIRDDAPIDRDELRAMIDDTIPDRYRPTFEAMKDVDYAYEVPTLGRFRVNILHERMGIGAVFRHIPAGVVTADDLKLPPALRSLCTLRRGLVLVTGPTGSGKSTTLAALIDLINRTRRDHIITIEDPIEFTHASLGCVVTQREVGEHTSSFKSALRAALREDPDVMLIGELRDLETVAIAIETAETGHLVFGTLHTTTAASTVDRIIDQFPGAQQNQIRSMLAGSLRAVISQTLCRRVDGGRVAAREVLFNSPAVANLIREGKIFQIPTLMQTSKRLGMATLNDALLELVVSGEIDPWEAHSHATDKDAFLAALKARGIDPDAAKGVPLRSVELDVSRHNMRGDRPDASAPGRNDPPLSIMRNRA